MSGINLRTTDFYYSSVSLNNHHMKTVTRNNQELKRKLISFENFLRNTFSRLNDYAQDCKGSMVDPEMPNDYLDLIDDIEKEYENNWSNGVPLFNTMINQLDEKKVDNDMYNFLLDILNHQKDVSMDVLNRTLTTDRTEIVFNHLKEVPYNLRSDLELESLPGYKPIESLPANFFKGEWEVITSGYGLKREGYRLGA